jgi:hypothetical protein
VVNQALDPGRDQVRWLGDGKNLTNIKVGNGSSQKYLFLNENIAAKQLTFQDLTLDANAKNTTGMLTTNYVKNISDLQYLNVKINGEGTTAFDWSNDYRVSMKNSEVIGKTTLLGNAQQVFIDGSKFFGTGNDFSLLFGRGIQMISITNSTAQNLDTSDPTTSKWVNGRFFVDQGWQAGRNQYLGNNQTIDLAPSSSSKEQNSGEQILWEQGGTTPYLGTVTSTTANTVTVNTPSALSGQYYLSVVGGKGIGQTRQIKSLNQATYTIYDNWNVQPDSSSVIVANVNVSNAVVYGNTLDGLSDYKTRVTASAGVQTYYGASNLIVDSNSFNELRTGVFLWAGWDSTANNPINFTQVSNNTFTNDKSGVVLLGSGSMGTSVLGNSINNNNFNNVGNIFTIGATNSTATNQFPGALMNVFENHVL